MYNAISFVSQADLNDWLANGAMIDRDAVFIRFDGRKFTGKNVYIGYVKKGKFIPDNNPTAERKKAIRAIIG